MSPTRREDEIKNRLREYLRREIIKDEGISLQDDDPLLSGGLIDSFSLVYIAGFIERGFGVRIPDTELSSETMDTINAMSERISRERP